MRKLSIVASFGLMLFCASVASAAPVTLNFSELSTRSVSSPNDLSFMGVTFRFRVAGLASPDARYNATGPGNLTFLQGAILEGDARGILTLDFSVPTTLLQFGAALTSADNLTPGLTVELFNPSLTSLGVTSLNTTNLLGISEGQFSYAGTPISRAVINFNETFRPIAPNVVRFGIDNLTFEPVPEPATLILFGTGIAGIGTALRKRRNRGK